MGRGLVGKNTKPCCLAFSQAGVGKCDLGGNTTLCLVKPHAVKAGLAGQIISKIQQVSVAPRLHDISILLLDNCSAVVQLAYKLTTSQRALQTYA